jgi:hypothetical protein
MEVNMERLIKAGKNGYRIRGGMGERCRRHG